MIALNNSTTGQKTSSEQPQAGLISEKSAIIICGLGVAIFALPILVIMQATSSLFWGGATIYKLLNRSDFGALEEI